MSKKEDNLQIWKEDWRMRGWELHKSGWKQKAIAETLGVAESTVSERVRKGNASGMDVLRNQSGRSRRAKLSDEQRKNLPELLQCGAESYGFRGNLWTNPRIAQVILREFGISYHPAHVSRILEDLGWTPQKQIHRAKQCKEDDVQKWWKERLPEAKKSPYRGANHRLHIRIRLLPVADAGAHLRSSRKNAHSERVRQSRLCTSME